MDSKYHNAIKADDSLVQENIFREQVDTLYRNIRFSSLGNVFASTVIFVALAGTTTNSINLQIWYVALICIAALRGIELRRYTRNSRKSFSV